MLTIDPSDCRLEIGVGRKFVRSLVWHFMGFLRQHAFEANMIEREAHRLADVFVADMQGYFRQTLSECYEELDNLSPEGIVELYLQQNLEDFKADYLFNRIDAASSVPTHGTGASRVTAPVESHACH